MAKAIEINMNQIWEILNRLTESSQNLETKLNESTKTLDTKIAESTKELTESNKKLDIKITEVADTNKNLDVRITESNKSLDLKIAEVSREVNETSVKLAKQIHLKLEESQKELSHKIDTIANAKFAQYTNEVKLTLDDFTKQINVNLRHQDENLNKAKLELNEHIHKRALDTKKKSVKLLKS